MKRFFLICFLTIIFTALLAGCKSNKTSPTANQPDQAAQQKETLAVVSNAPGEWKSDGKISDNEYISCQKIGDLQVYTRLAGDSVMFGLAAKTEGYLALGFDPDGNMKDVDIIMCSIKDGNAMVNDLFCGGKHSRHQPDSDAGGKMDLTNISGSRNDLNSVFEFKRKLDTGDSLDKALKTGENKVIWAVGLTGDTTREHSREGEGTLVLQSN